MNGSKPAIALNLLAGKWRESEQQATIPDPLNGDGFVLVPDTRADETQDFIDSLKTCPKYGLHNPLHNPERYRMLGDVSAKAAAAMRDPKVEDFFTRGIQRVSPKSYAQALGEVRISRIFLENFSGDQVRFLARSFVVAGDHNGQASAGHRWPFGPVCLITPFNFPLEIPCLQLMGALYMGNKPLVKVDSRVSILFEQFVRLLVHCGLPAEDVDMIHCDGPVMNDLLLRAQPASTLFTGSSTVGEKLAKELHGKIFLEDAGFDWKVLGPDVPADPKEQDYVAWQCDQDAYACSGQKCSAQSILFAHSSWVASGILDKLKENASRRSLADLSVGPTLTVTCAAFRAHIDRLLEIPGARVLFGGNELKGHAIPSIYGAMEPTAVFVPLEQLMVGCDAPLAKGPGPNVDGSGSPKLTNFQACTKEIFAPFQVVTEYTEAQLPLVLKALERMHNHLTAAVVSNDQAFLGKVLAHTVNGTTYAGIRARTTGAPENHWFGPAGDPRAAGIGTPEAIRLVWSCHREIIHDVGPIDKAWTQPPPS